MWHQSVGGPLGLIVDSYTLPASGSLFSVKQDTHCLNKRPFPRELFHSTRCQRLNYGADAAGSRSVRSKVFPVRRKCRSFSTVMSFGEASAAVIGTGVMNRRAPY